MGNHQLPEKQVEGCTRNIAVDRYTFTVRIFKGMNTTVNKKEKDFDTVAFFRDVKERMAKATEGMTLLEKREYWKQLREGKVKLE